MPEENRYSKTREMMFTIGARDLSGFSNTVVMKLTLSL
jgi:hypothetical protein